MWLSPTSQLASGLVLERDGFSLPEDYALQDLFVAKITISGFWTVNYERETNYVALD